MHFRCFAFGLAGAAFAGTLFAGTGEGGWESYEAPPPEAGVIAKQLQNPLSPMLRLNFNNEFTGGIKPHSGTRYFLNLQIYGGLDVSEDWLLLMPSNSILLVHQNDVVGSGDAEFGMGDMTQSLWLSPTRSGVEDFYWGTGLFSILPFATNSKIGAEQWGLGPEAVVAWQPGPWTFGLLANHVWRVAGSTRRSRLNATTINPFIARDLGDAYQLRFEAFLTYDWTLDEWNAPLGFALNKTFYLGKTPFSVGVNARCNVDRHVGFASWTAGVQFVWAMP